jgi:2-polyprenyl-6-methoxyphenol hydroxylase-like FAD-dependent oxidoreductase
MRHRSEALDLVIAGAGPVGLATAIQASLRGLSAVVLERRSKPLDKACGEGVMPAGVTALAAMGVKLRPDECRRFVGIRYVDDELVAEGRFQCGTGLGIQRLVLAERLLERTRELGMVVRLGCSVEGWEEDGTGVWVHTRDGPLRGRYLVAADGLHSRIRRLAQLDAPRRRRIRSAPRYGIRQHFSTSPWSEFVEVHIAGGMEAYVTPVAADVVGVALLFSRTSVRAGQPHASRSRTAGRPTQGTRFEALLERLPALQDKLRDAERLDAPRGAGPLRQPVRRRFAGRVALVGDAAGYLDALSGQGLELGFAGAAALIEVLKSGAPLSHYEQAYRRLSRRYYLGTELLLQLARNRPLRRGSLRLLRATPALFDRLLAAIDPGERRLAAAPVSPDTVSTP